MSVSNGDVLATLGASIRRWRRASRLTIAQLAERAQIDTGFLAYIESGKKAPSLRTVAKLADALGVTIGELFSAPESSESAGPRAELLREARSLCKGCSASQIADLLTVFKMLHDPKRVRALRSLWGKA